MDILTFKLQLFMKHFLTYATMLLTLAITGCQEDKNDDNNPLQPSAKTHNTIHYTTTDGEIISSFSLEAIDATLVSNTYENGVGSLVFDKDITSIGERAFMGCNKLTSITIPKKVTSLGKALFAYCPNLAEFKGQFATEDGLCLINEGVLYAYAPASKGTEYTIPEGVIIINMGAFVESKSLRKVTIPNSVGNIDIQAFSYCSNLTEITIPSSVTLVGESVFYSCSSLSKVYCRPTTPPAIARVMPSDQFLGFGNTSGALKIYVPTQSVNLYKEADGWRDYESVIVGYDY